MSGIFKTLVGITAIAILKDYNLDFFSIYQELFPSMLDFQGDGMQALVWKIQNLGDGDLHPETNGDWR